MIPRRTKLLAEYGPYGMSLRGLTRPLPFSDVDIAGLSARAMKRREEEQEAAVRRRERLRELALEQWRSLVAALTD